MSTMPNMPARLTNPLGIILVVMLLLVIRVQAALRWRTLSVLSALMPCPAIQNRCACSNAKSSAEPANRAANKVIANGWCGATTAARQRYGCRNTNKRTL